MKNMGRLARVTALTVVALAAVGGVAGAASKGNAPAVHGTVTAVNGDSTPGVCGTAGATGSFTLTGKTITTTVNVDGTTTFLDKSATSPSFANLCVGDIVVAAGPDSAFVMSAQGVTVHGPKPPPRVHLFGSILSVNGDPTTGVCGTAGATGAFVLSTIEGVTTVVTTVDVDSTTLFTEAHVTDASFANVCVGDKAVALGSGSGGTIAATLVAIRIPPPPKPPKPLHVSGIVASVGGDSRSGTCGIAGDAGTFTAVSTDNATVPPTTKTWTVNVTSGTAYAEKGATSASFANVCVGEKTVSLGTTTDGALDAVAVAIWPLKVPKG